MANYVKLTAESPIMKESGSPHVDFVCENHPELRWTAKSIAASVDSCGDVRYNGTRNIFFASDYPAKECDCPSSKLVGVEKDPVREAALEEKYAYLKGGTQA